MIWPGEHTATHDLLVGIHVHVVLVPAPLPVPVPVPAPFVVPFVGYITADVWGALRALIATPPPAVEVNALGAGKTGRRTRGLHIPPPPYFSMGPGEKLLGDAKLWLGSPDVYIGRRRSVQSIEAAFSCTTPKPLRVPSTMTLALHSGVPVVLGSGHAFDWEQVFVDIANDIAAMVLGSASGPVICLVQACIANWRRILAFVEAPTTEGAAELTGAILEDAARRYARRTGDAAVEGALGGLRANLASPAP